MTGFELTERVLPWLKLNIQKTWHDFNPQGVVDSSFDFSFANGTLTKEFHAKFREASFLYSRVPFQFHQCSGTMDLKDEKLKIDLLAVEAQQKVSITAEIDNPGDDWTGWLETRGHDWFPINEKILTAFKKKPDLQSVLRKFNATGYVGGWGRVERFQVDQEPKQHYEIQFQQAAVRHEHFDYPIYNIDGLVVIDNERTEFRQIKGVNNHGQIECNGTWDETSGLNLRFLAGNVLLNDELRSALPVSLQKTWQGLRPSGTADLVDVDMRFPIGAEKVDVAVAVRIPLQDQRVSSMAIYPVWFPYEMRQVTGEFRFQENQIDIRNFAAVHADTTVNANGTGTYDQSSWKIRFSELFAANVELDESLRQALPSTISQSLDRMKFDGNLSLRGMVEVSGQFVPETEHQPATAIQLASFADVDAKQANSPNVNLNWNLDIGIGRAKANLGLQFDNASGVLSMNGQYTQGRLDCRGKVSIDSMLYQDIQVTSIIVPFSINNHQISFGGLAKHPTDNSPEARSASATGRLFGGYIECDGQMLFNQSNDYFLQAALTHGSLDEFAVETSMQQHDFSGQAYAGIQLSGDAIGLHSTRGNGYIQLRNAKIYEVPVVLALLNVLRVREPDRTAFDTGEMTFKVNGNNFDFEKIELNGDAISLIGKGTVTLDTEIDLDFYTMVGRNRLSIPILTELYHAGSQQVWWVEVDGTLDSPQTNHQVLPGLTDSLRRLFPDFVEKNSTENKER